MWPAYLKGWKLFGSTSIALMLLGLGTCSVYGWSVNYSNWRSAPPKVLLTPQDMQTTPNSAFQYDCGIAEGLPGHGRRCHSRLPDGYELVSYEHDRIAWFHHCDFDKMGSCRDVIRDARTFDEKDVIEFGYNEHFMIAKTVSGDHHVIIRDCVKNNVGDCQIGPTTFDALEDALVDRDQNPVSLPILVRVKP